MKQFLYLIIAILIAIIICLSTCNKQKSSITLDIKYKDSLQWVRDTLAINRAFESVQQEIIAEAETGRLALQTRSDEAMSKLAKANKEVNYWVRQAFEQGRDTSRPNQIFFYPCDSLALAALVAQKQCDSVIILKDSTIMWYKGEVGSYKLITQSMAHDTTLYGQMNKVLENRVNVLEKAALPYRTVSAGAEMGSLMPGNAYLKAVIEYNTANGYHYAGSFGYQTTGLKIVGVKVSKDIFKINKKH